MAKLTSFVYDLRSDVYFPGIPTGGSDFHRHCFPSLSAFRLDSLYVSFDAQIAQAVLAVGASQRALVDLFERIENLFTRLRIYIDIPPTPEMTDIIVKVMVDVLLILALVTSEIKQRKISTFNMDDCHLPSTNCFFLERFMKKLVGRSDIEDALRRFDKLTQEEGRMAAAEGLRATHAVGDGMKVAINKMDAVLDGTHLVFLLSTSSSNLWLGGENVREELQQVSRDVCDLAKDAKRS